MRWDMRASNTAQNQQEHRSVAELEIKSNFIFSPGTHTALSCVTGARSHELDLIYEHKAIFSEYQRVVYDKQKLNIIPIEYKDKADIISKEIFNQYIEKYKSDGLTVDNAVSWNNLMLTKTYLHDLENEWNTWHTESTTANINCSSHIKDKMYRPAYICALHELMHVEETAKKISKKEYKKFDSIAEVLTVTRTLILMDEVYKRTLEIPLEIEVDYKNNFYIFGKSISQGQLANFYRSLELKHTSLADALISEESTMFLGYKKDQLLLQNNSNHSAVTFFHKTMKDLLERKIKLLEPFDTKIHTDDSTSNEKRRVFT